MKTFRFGLEQIFKGLCPLEKDNINDPMLDECHNLVPLGNGFRIHRNITDLNEDNIAWGGTGGFLRDDWDDDGKDFINE